MDRQAGDYEQKSAVEDKELKDQNLPVLTSALVRSNEGDELRREFKWFEWSTLVVQIVLVVVGLLALKIYHAQLVAMQGQLMEMKSSSDQTQKLLSLYSRQVDEMSKQSLSAKISSTAAKSAADTAASSFYYSERAYLTIQDSHLDAIAKVFHLDLTNTGRIPSGPAHVLIHYATYVPDDIKFAAHPSIPEAHGWQQLILDSVSPNSHPGIDVTLQEIVPDYMSRALQQVEISGTITYADGFPASKPQIYKFCLSERYQIVGKRFAIERCDPDSEIKKMTLLDGYPLSKPH